MNQLLLNLTAKPNKLLFALAVLAAGIFFLISMVVGATLTLVVFAVTVFMLLFISLGLEKELYGLFFLVVVLYLFPYSTPDPEARRSGEYLTIYSRFSMFLSPWDYLIFILGGIWLYKNARKDNAVIRWVEYPEMKIYIGIMAFAFFFGVLHVKGLLLSYGPTKVIMPIVSLLPFYYFMVFYLFTINFMKSKQDVDSAIRLVWIIGLIMIVYSAVRLFLILNGYIDTMWGFGMPMIVYDQGILLIFPVLLYFSFVLLKIKSRYRNFFVSFLLFLLVLATTRRFNYLLTMLGSFSVLFLAWKSREMKFPRLMGSFLKFLVIAFVIVLLISVFNPGLVEGVRDSVVSIYFLTDSGMALGGSTRKAEIENIFLNMNEEGYPYIVGFGLGTMWHEKKDVPFDTFAFTAKALEGNQSWYPQFHLPYINKIFRFGLVGVVTFFVIFIFFLKRSLSFIKNIRKHSVYKAYLLAISAYLLILMFETGDSHNPTAPIFCGFLYGLQTSIARFCTNNNTKQHE